MADHYDQQTEYLKRNFQDVLKNVTEKRKRCEQKMQRLQKAQA